MLGKIDRDVPVFRSEHRVREIDGEIEHEPLMWIEARPLVVLPRFDGRLDPQIAFGSRLLDDAGRLQQKDERPRASIHDRDLGTGNVDVQIVDSQPGKRRHQMLHRRDSSSVLFQRRRQARVADIASVSGYRYRFGQIGAVENNAGIRRRGAQHHLDAYASVQTNPGRLDLVLERALSEHH